MLWRGEGDIFGSMILIMGLEHDKLSDASFPHDYWQDILTKEVLHASRCPTLNDYDAIIIFDINPLSTTVLKRGQVDFCSVNSSQKIQYN